jgi:hypothetical protein
VLSSAEISAPEGVHEVRFEVEKEALMLAGDSVPGWAGSAKEAITTDSGSKKRTM